MFDKFKMMGLLGALMKDKDRLRDAGERIRSRIAEVRATGEGGGGAVRITVSGQMKLLAVELQPALTAGMATDERTRGLAGSLIADAANEALADAQRQVREIIEREARELGLPELPEDLRGLLA